MKVQTLLKSIKNPGLIQNIIFLKYGEKKKDF